MAIRGIEENLAFGADHLAHVQETRFGHIQKIRIGKIESRPVHGVQNTIRDIGWAGGVEKLAAALDGHSELRGARWRNLSPVLGAGDRG